MGKVSKETKREQRYNANLHNIFVKAQEEIANKQYGRNLCPSHQKDTGTLLCWQFGIDEHFKNPLMSL